MLYQCLPNTYTYTSGKICVQYMPVNLFRNGFEKKLILDQWKCSSNKEVELNLKPY